MKETVVRGLISIIEDLGLMNNIEKLGVNEYHRRAGGLMNYITLHYRHFKRHLHLKWSVVHQQLHVIRDTAHRPSTQASYTASRVRPERKISCAAAQISATQIAATLTISFPRWRHMSLTSYWGQQRMSLTSYRHEYHRRAEGLMNIIEELIPKNHVKNCFHLLSLLLASEMTAMLCPPTANQQCHNSDGGYPEIEKECFQLINPTVWRRKVKW